jgi:hypothetical protein
MEGARHFTDYDPHTGFLYYNPTFSVMRTPPDLPPGMRWAALLVWVLATFRGTLNDNLIGIGHTTLEERYSLFVCLMVFNATSNNISVISWRSVLLVEETEGPGENHRPVASQCQTLTNIMLCTSLTNIRPRRPLREVLISYT